MTRTTDPTTETPAPALPVQVRRVPLAERLCDVLGAADAITEATPVDDLLLLDGLSKCLTAMARDLSARIKERKIAWIEHNGDIDLGNGKREYVGPDKDTTCNDPREVLVALLEATGGDEEAVVTCLASGAWKYGTVKRLLEEHGMGDRYAQLFTVTEAKDVKTGAAKKSVRTFDPAFAK
jgi:hypothetical protein